ncbi:MAG TPA: phosphatase PAP2 family protein [Candidatus Pelethosoma merdigallinarum]|nr:phosphatase PAP2 family protein [Candidatus Pelethosoma merdigallinarum]
MKKYKCFFFFFALAIFILFTILVVTNNVAWFDDPIYHWLHSLFHDQTTTFFLIITSLSSPLVLIVMSLLLLITNKDHKLSLLVILNLLLSTIGNTILKGIFLRERPSDFPLIDETGYSYPSGHSMISMAFYGFLIYIIWQTNWSKRTKIIFSICLGLIIFLIGCSRIYLRVHYPSDVVAGFAISFIYLCIFIHIIKKKWSV